MKKTVNEDSFYTFSRMITSSSINMLKKMDILAPFFALLLNGTIPSTKDNTEKVFDVKAETDYDTVLQPALHQIVTLFQIYLSTNKLIFI